MKLVIQNSAHVWGGNEKSLVTLGRGLMSRGHDVAVSCASGPVRERALEAGLRVTRFRPRGSIDPLSGGSFMAWLAMEKPHALLITSWHSISWGSLAARVAGVSKVVLRQGIVRRPPTKGVRSYALEHWVDDVITNAPEIRDVWLESLPKFQDRVHVVLNAVTANQSHRIETRRALRRELGITGATLLIGAAGIVTRRKNFDLLLRAFARSKPDDTRVVITGDGPHLPELRQLAAELGVESSVIFTGARSNAAELIAGLDIFVLSSRNEGMANVMLEAMASGTPVIASDISGVQTAIGETEERPSAGWIFPVDDEVRLSALIADVVTDIRKGGDCASSKAREALWRIQNWFTMERMLDQSEQILFG